MILGRFSCFKMPKIRNSHLGHSFHNLSVSEFGDGRLCCHYFNQVTGIVGSSHIVVNLVLSKIQKDYFNARSYCKVISNKPKAQK